MNKTTINTIIINQHTRGGIGRGALNVALCTARKGKNELSYKNIERYFQELGITGEWEFVPKSIQIDPGDWKYEDTVDGWHWFSFRRLTLEPYPLELWLIPENQQLVFSDPFREVVISVTPDQVRELMEGVR